MMLTTSTGVLSDNVVVLRLVGVLNVRTYRQVRDAVIKIALDQSAAVIVDTDGLDVPDNYAWAVFAAARWQVNQSPDVPIVLVSNDEVVRQRLAPLSVTRYVPVYASVAAAAEAIHEGNCRYRHRARAHFSRRDGGVRAAQMFVRNHLMDWSMFEKIPVVTAVVTVFIENALRHNGDGCDLRLEGTDEGVFISVTDVPELQCERAPDGTPAGLDIVAALCPRSGSTATYSGSLGWARVGPNDSITGIGQLLQ